MIIRKLEKKDIAACLTIFNYYIENTMYSMELEPLNPETFTKRIDGIPDWYPKFVCEEDGKLIGYAYLHAFLPREGYIHTAEMTMYIDKDNRDRGIGRMLANKLIEESKAVGIWDIITIITGENANSFVFNKRIGFKEIAVFPGIAEKFGRRISVHYMQLKLK